MSPGLTPTLCMFPLYTSLIYALILFMGYRNKIINKQEDSQKNLLAIQR